MIIQIAEKDILINNIPGTESVRCRNSDNYLIQDKLVWKPSIPLKEGIPKLIMALVKL